MEIGEVFAWGNATRYQPETWQFYIQESHSDLGQVVDFYVKVLTWLWFCLGADLFSTNLLF